MKQFSTITPTKILFNNKPVKAKIISVSSLFNHNINTFFAQELIKQNTVDIVKPFASIRFIKQNTDSPFWQQGFKYELKIKPFGLFNIWGIHYINVISINKQMTTIITEEKNNICKLWSHTLTFEKVNINETLYTDQVILYAGILTNLLSYFLAFSYRKRHAKWNVILRKNAYS